MFEFTSHLIPLVANIGMLALLAWAVSLSGAMRYHTVGRMSRRMSVVLGISCGLAAAFLINIPVEIQPGIQGDGRGAPLLMSGIIGGPIAALIAMVIGGAMRLYLGGAGAMPGAAYIAIICVIGAVWGEYHRRTGRSDGTSTGRLVLLAVIATIATIPLVLMLPPALQFSVLISLYPIFGIANVIGIAVLGTLIGHEMTRRQHEVELVAQKEAARNATIAKSRFVAAISHDIRTPMNGILGVLQMTDRFRVDDEFRARLEVAKNSGFYLLSLINQVLDFSRIESDKLQHSEEEFTLGGIASDIESIFGFQFEDKGIALETNSPKEDTGTYLGDVTHIRQILFNLVGNALKYTDRGKVSVHFKVVDVSEESAQLKIFVQDEGIGIPKTDLPRIFDEFAKASNARGAGTGLGLSIVNKIVQSIGGSIEIESVVDLGTKVTCLVPIRVVSQNVNDEGPGEPVVQNQSVRLLVAEDNPINQMIVESFLKDAGHRTTIVENGKHAVDAVKEGPGDYDLVLMDIQMPEMDGVEASREIRKLGALAADLPILALTANAFEDQKQDYLAAGMQDVLTKPIKQEVLLDAIQNHVAKTSPGKSVSSDGANPVQGDRETHVEYDQIKNLIDVASVAKVSELVEKMGEECNRVLGQIDAALNQGQSAAKPAHELKGMALGFGLAGVAEMAKKLEKENMNPAQHDEFKVQLRREVDESLKLVREYVASRHRNELSD